MIILKKLSILVLFTCFLVTVSGNAFAWTDRVEGRPEQSLKQMIYNPSLSVWHDGKNEFHLKSTSMRGHHVFTGVIRTDGRFYDIEQRQLENGDFIKVDRQRDTIRFRLTGRGIDEISFNVKNGDYVKFDLYKDGEEMPRKDIFIGRNGWHPRDNRFTLR